jgi:hypothetical protein
MAFNDKCALSRKSRQFICPSIADHAVNVLFCLVDNFENRGAVYFTVFGTTKIQGAENGWPRHTRSGPKAALIAVIFDREQCSQFLVTNSRRISE